MDELAPVEVSGIDANESQASYHGFSQFIKPDMLMNIYSLVDFWLSEVCEYHRRNGNLRLSSKDIKGDNELQARHKYLTTYAGLNLSSLDNSYNRLGELRKVRNTFVHGGGHIPSSRETEFSSINGISLYGSLIVIDDSFIWDTLEHAKKYLKTAVHATA